MNWTFFLSSPITCSVRESLLAVLDKCCESCVGDCLSWCLLCCWAFRTGTTIFSSFLQTQPCTSFPELTLFFQHASQCAEQTQQYFPRLRVLFFFQDSQHPKHGIISDKCFFVTEIHFVLGDGQVTWNTLLDVFTFAVNQLLP